MCARPSMRAAKVNGWNTPASAFFSADSKRGGAGSSAGFSCAAAADAITRKRAPTFFFMGRTISRPLAQDARRVAGDHRVGGHVAGDDGAGADLGAFADGDAGEDDGADAEVA